MSENEPMIQTPAEFGQFELQKELGHGGMGGVYLARDKMLDRMVAIKVMSKSLGADPLFVERFQREAQAAARLNHPNIAQIYSFGQENGMPYIAMELVSGGSLDKEMESNPGTLDAVRVMAIGQQMANALSVAAEQGLVHGDVKPENVLFDAEGNAKLVDFGLAAMQGDSDEIWGTPYYISPEKVKRQKIDYRADIYSLGGTLYHALTGVPPFDGADPTEVVKARFEGAPKKPTEVRPDLPDGIDEIILRMLEVEPAMRYPTYESLLGDLKRFLAKFGNVKLTTKVAGPKIKFKGKRNVVRLSAEEGVGAPVEDAAELAPVEEEEEKKGLSVGAIIGLVAAGLVLVTIATVGGLMWYVHSTKVAEQEKRALEITTTADKARAAIRETVASIQKFGESFHELVERSDKIMAETVSELRKIIPDELKEETASLILPPPTKEMQDAAVYTNELYAAFAAKEKAEAAQKEAEAAAEKAAEAARVATTNNPAATAVTTNAPAAVNASTNAPVAAAGTNKVEAVNAEAKNPEEKTEEAAEETPAEGEAGQETKPEEKKMEIPNAINDFRELWNDAYYCRAADIRVQANVALLLKRAEKVNELNPDNVSAFEEKTKVVEALAKFSQEMVEQFEMTKGMKCVEQTRRKVTLIRSRAKTILENATRQIRVAKLKAEREAKKVAEAAAKAEAEKREAEEHAALEEAEVNAVNTKYESLVSMRLKHLEWEPALKQINGITVKTQKGRDARNLAKTKIELMRDLQYHFVKHAKGFEFRNGSVVTAVTKDSLTVQKRRKIKGKWSDSGSPSGINWNRFYARQQYIGMMNEFINKLVMQGRERLSLNAKTRANLMFGAALTLQTLFTENEGAAAFVPVLVKDAVKDFEACREEATRLFPGVTLDASEE